MEQDCVHNGGIASITLDVLDNYLVVCKDGSGPWKEVADAN